MGFEQANPQRDLAWGKFVELRTLMKNQKRLKTAPYRICCDGGKYVGGEIKVGDRTIKMIKYETKKNAKAS